ncbi:MAG: hypothetical protein ABGX63_04205 [bacterium]
MAVGAGVGVAVAVAVAVAVGAGVAVGVDVGGTGVGGVVVRLTSDAHAAKTNSNETIAITNLDSLIN